MIYGLFLFFVNQYRLNKLLTLFPIFQGVRDRCAFQIQPDYLLNASYPININAFTYRHNQLNTIISKSI